MGLRLLRTPKGATELKLLKNLALACASALALAGAAQAQDTAYVAVTHHGGNRFDIDPDIKKVGRLLYVAIRVTGEDDGESILTFNQVDCAAHRIRIFKSVFGERTVDTPFPWRSAAAGAPYAALIGTACEMGATE